MGFGNLQTLTKLAPPVPTPSLFPAASSMPPLPRWLGAASGSLPCVFKALPSCLQSLQFKPFRLSSPDYEG